MRFNALNLAGWLCAGTLFMAGAALSAEKSDEGDQPVKPRRELGPDGLPKYHHPYQDGLYSTVTSMNSFWVPEKLPGQKKIKLKVPGFKKDMPVHAILKDYNAPLVVVLTGVDGKVDGPWGGLFPYWYSEAGYHVLTFDSTFTPPYADICGQGVVGNFEAEADQIASIINAYLKLPEVQKRVTRVGVIGMSFGGTQALLLAAKDMAGKLPFELSGCLALSPMVNLRTAARTVDRFFDQDRWDMTMIELAERFGPHVPVAEGQPIPFKAGEMRAAVGFVFRYGLTDVVERNDSAYRLGILPGVWSEENRGTYAQATGFERFMETYTFPYWQKKGVVKSVDELWDMGDLSKILPRLPSYAEAVVAENDPFATSEDLAAAKAADANKCLTTVPVGGHLGFIAADWTLVKALRLFKKKAPQAAFDRNDLDRARKEALEAAKANSAQFEPADK